MLSIPPTRRFLKQKFITRTVFVLFAFLATTAAAGYWLFNSPSGSHWLLSTLSRISSGSISFEGIQGPLKKLHVERLNITHEDTRFVLQQVKLNWQPDQLISRKLFIKRFSAHSLAFYSSATKEKNDPSTLPTNLKLPIAVTVQNFEVEELTFFTEGIDEPDFSASNLFMQLQSNGQHHRLTQLSANSKLGAFNSTAEINGDHPFVLSAQATLSDPTQWGALKTTLSGNLEQIEVEINGSGSGITGDINSRIEPYANFPINLLTISLEKLNPALFASNLPDVEFSVLTNLQKNSTHPLSGDLAITNHTISPLDQDGLPFSQLHTSVQLSDTSFQLNDINLQFSNNGLIFGDIVWHQTQASGQADIEVSKINPMDLDSRLQAAQVSGEIKLTGNEKIQNAIIALNDNALLLQASIEHSDNILTLENFLLRHGQSRLNGQGRLDFAREQSYFFTGNLEQFNISDFIKAPASDLNTSLSLAGNLSPQITGVFNYTFNQSHFADHAVLGSGQIIYNGPEQFASQTKLQIGANHLQTSGQFGVLNKSLQIDINAPSLAQIGFGLSGRLTSKLELGGQFESPEIHFDIDGRHLRYADAYQIENLSTQGRFSDQDIALKLQATNFSAENKTQLQDLALSVSGKKSKHQIHTQLQIDDDTNLNLSASGGIQTSSATNHAYQWHGKLTKLSLSGATPLQLQTPTSLTLAAEKIILGTTQLAIAGGHAHIDETSWTPQAWQTRGHFSGIAVHHGNDLIAQQDILHLGGNWHFVSNQQLNGQLQVKREKGDWYTTGDFIQPLGLETLGLFIQVKDKKIISQFDLTSKNIGQANALLTFPISRSDQNWSIPDDTPLDGNLLINTTDLSWLEALVDDNIKTGGQLKFQADIAGTVKTPKLSGKISGQELSFSLLDEGLQLEEGKLSARFNQSNLHIDQLNFSSPFEPAPNDKLLRKLSIEEKPGTLDITGTIGFTEDRHYVTAKLDQLPLSHPSNYWIILSGNSQAEIQNNLLNLSGDIVVDAGLLMQPPSGQPVLSDDIIIGEKTIEETSEPLTMIDATLDLGNNFYIRAAGLEGKLVGRLQVDNDDKHLLNVTGSIATQKATFTAYGQKLKVNRGIVNFQGPLDDPGLNVLATRTGIPVKAGVEVMGSVRHPKIRLTSTPEMPDSEKLSWVVLGHSLQEGNVDASLLLTAASSILGDQSGGGGITQQLSDALGVDQISFRQGETGNPLGSQIGTIGKRISSRAFISYERGLTTTTAGVTKLTYNLTPRIKIETRAGIDSAVDMFYTFRFD